jgi:beta-glucosidase-like glycosyl hydrolase
VVYNDYDGKPVIASRQFLMDILRKEYGFKGYVVSDSGAVEFVHQKHRVAQTPSDAISCSQRSIAAPTSRASSPAPAPVAAARR